MKDQELLTINDRLLSQDRWICFLIISGLLVGLIFIYQLNEINKLYENVTEEVANPAHQVSLTTIKKPEARTSGL